MLHHPAAQRLEEAGALERRVPALGDGPVWWEQDRGDNRLVPFASRSVCGDGRVAGIDGEVSVREEWRARRAVVVELPHLGAAVGVIVVFCFRVVYYEDCFLDRGVGEVAAGGGFAANPNDVTVDLAEARDQRDDVVDEDALRGGVGGGIGDEAAAGLGVEEFALVEDASAGGDGGGGGEDVPVDRPRAVLVGFAL